MNFVLPIDIQSNRPLIGLAPVFVDSSSYATNHQNTLWSCMRGQCIDLPLDSVPWLYAVAVPPTMANEQSISLRCLWSCLVFSFHILSKFRSFALSKSCRHFWRKSFSRFWDVTQLQLLLNTSKIL